MAKRAKLSQAHRYFHQQLKKSANAVLDDVVSFGNRTHECWFDLILEFELGAPRTGCRCRVTTPPERCWVGVWVDTFCLDFQALPRFAGPSKSESALGAKFESSSSKLLASFCTMPEQQPQRLPDASKASR